MRASFQGKNIRRVRRAFTLVELVMVVTIIGMIASIAVPRISSAASSASVNALAATLANVRKSIDAYYAEHGKYPGYNPINGTPNGVAFVNQLTKYTDEAGRPNATYGTPYNYGPYLRAPFPANPFNKLNTVHVKLNHGTPSPADGSVGWVAVLSDGSFGLSVTDVQLEGVGIMTVAGKSKVRVEID